MESSATLIWGLLFGAIGTGYFLYGKKQRKPVPFACGILLIVFPYFIAHVAALVMIGALLSAIPYFFRR